MTTPNGTTGHTRPDIIVVGASAGGLKALATVLGGLPRGFPVPIVAVQHRARESTTRSRRCSAREARSRCRRSRTTTPLRAPGVYLAPPDYHVLVEPGRIAAVGRRSGLVQPAVHRRALRVRRRCVRLARLRGAPDRRQRRRRARVSCASEQAGGNAIVQDPHTAESPEMPAAGIASAPVDQVLPLNEIAAELVRRSRDVTRFVIPDGVKSLDDTLAPSTAATESASNILIVDDEPSNLLALEAILEPLESNLVRAASGKRGAPARAQGRLLRRPPRRADAGDRRLRDRRTAAQARSHARRADHLPHRDQQGPRVRSRAATTSARWTTSFKPYEPGRPPGRRSPCSSSSRAKNAIIRAQHEALRVRASASSPTPRSAASSATTTSRTRCRSSSGRPIPRASSVRQPALGDARARLARVGVRSSRPRISRASWRAGTRRWSRDSLGSRAPLRQRRPRLPLHLVRVVPRHDDRNDHRPGSARAPISTRASAPSARSACSPTRAGASVPPSTIRWRSRPCSAARCPSSATLAILDVHRRGAGAESASRWRRAEGSARLLDDPRFDLGPSTVAYSGRPEIYLDVAEELRRRTRGAGSSICASSASSASPRTCAFR